MSLLGVAALAAAYVAGAGLGFLVAPTHHVVSSAWPPAGIAIAALVLYGRRLWPGVAIGAFAANYVSGIPPGASIVIAAGNTLEAVAALWLLRHLAFRPAMDRLRDVLALIVAAFLTAILSASVGVTTLFQSGAAGGRSADALWLSWWTGDTIGILVIASVLMTWMTPSASRASARSVAEAAGLIVGLAALTGLVVASPFPYVYPVFPVAGLAAYRLGPRGAAAANVTVAAVAAYYTIAGVGAFAFPERNPAENAFLFQAFVALLAVTTLSSAAVLAEREQAELALRSSEARLSEAQAAAQLGSWTWEPGTGRVSWSDELYRVYGMARGAFQPSLQAYLDRVHPADRDRVAATVRRAFEERTPFHMDERIVRPDGAIRVLESRGKVVQYGSEAVMIGICQDVTDLRRAQETLAASEAKFSTLFRASPVAICVISMADMTVVDANARFFEMLGQSGPPSAIGSSTRDLGMWTEPGELRDIVARLRLQRSIREAPVKYSTRGGPERRALAALELIEIGGAESIVALFWRP